MTGYEWKDIDPKIVVLRIEVIRTLAFGAFFLSAANLALLAIVLYRI